MSADSQQQSGDGPQDRAALERELCHTRETLQSTVEELETRNEELRRAHDELAEARDRYRELYKFAPVGYLTVDARGMVLNANLAAARLAGRERGSIVNRRLEKILAVKDRDACYVLLREASRDEPAAGEFRLDRPDGEEMRVRMEVVPDGLKDSPGCRVTLTDVTQRSQAEGALDRQRELLQRIVDTIPVLLVMWDPALERFTLNRHATEVLGWTAEDANEGDWMERVYPDRAYRQEVSRFMTSLDSGWREFRTTAKSGEEIPIDWANVQLTDDTMIGIGVDLRERKAAEQALRASEQRYRLAAWAARLGAYTRDLQTGEDYWSPEFKKIYGLGPEDELKLKDGLPAAIHPEDFESIQEETRRRQQGKQDPQFTSEHRIIRQDGQLCWVLLRGRMEFDDAGEPSTVYGFAMDITEQKWAQRALRHSEERFRSLVESSAQAVWETTAEGIVIKDSPSWRKFTGQHLEQWLAEGWVEAIHPDDREATLRAWRNAVRTGQPLETEYRLQRPNGTYSWTTVRAASIHDAEGHIVKWVGMNVDITDRKEAEIALREAREQLEQRVEERTAELSETVEELKTSIARRELAEKTLRSRSEALFELNQELEKRTAQLQSLTLQLSMAEDRERRHLSEILHDDLQQLMTAARFHLSIIAGEDLPDLAADEFQQLDELLTEAAVKMRDLSHQLYPAVLHQDGLVEALGWLADDMSDRHGLEVECDVPPEVEPHSRQLRPFLFKAARELLFNVVKHSGVRRASLFLKRHDGAIEVCVTDEGRGFDPACLDETNAKAGLGLITIRERTEFLGGSVQVESVADKGSRFTVRVPDPDDQG